MPALRSLLSPMALEMIKQLKGQQSVKNGTMPPLPKGFRVKNRNDCYVVYRENAIVGHVDSVADILPLVETVVKKNLTRIRYEKVGRAMFRLVIDGKVIKVMRSKKALTEYFRANYGE